MPGTLTLVALTFDGTEEIIGDLAFNESYAVYDGSRLDLFNLNYLATPLTLPYGWTTPGHLLEFSVRDIDGASNEGGGLVDVFLPNVLQFDGINVNSTAVPVFSADRPTNDPGLVPFNLDNTFIGIHFYFKKHGMPANPTNALDIAGPFFEADHPSIAGQTMFLGVGQYDQFDYTLSHGIGDGTFSVCSDTERDVFGFTFLDLA